MNVKPKHKLPKGYRRPRRKLRKRRGGIWVTNKFGKERNRKPIEPQVKVCILCGKRRVIHHHFYCDVCWRKANEYKLNLNLGGKVYKVKTPNENELNN